MYILELVPRFWGIQEVLRMHGLSCFWMNSRWAMTSSLRISELVQTEEWMGHYQVDMFGAIFINQSIYIYMCVCVCPIQRTYGRIWDYGDMPQLSCGWNKYGKRKAGSLFLHSGCEILVGCHRQEEVMIYEVVDRMPEGLGPALGEAGRTAAPPGSFEKNVRNWSYSSWIAQAQAIDSPEILVLFCWGTFLSWIVEILPARHKFWRFRCSRISYT